jgi:hypothetical protein
MTSVERAEITRSLAELRECVQALEVQAARLEKTVEALDGLQRGHAELQSRVAELLGFRAAMLWCAGIVGAGALGRFLVMIAGR